MFYRTILTSTAMLVASATSAEGVASRIDEIDQIVVSGAMTPLTINQLGSAATVIDRAEIERRQLRYVSDLLRSVPGFAVSQTGVAGSQTQVRVRGAEANHVLVMIDGVRATDPATGDEFRWEHLSTANIERIEVIRGPQSALWGSDAVAAVVQIVTRSGADAGGADGFLEGGSNATRNLGVNGSVGDDDWSLSASIEQLHTDGSNIARTGDENDDSNITTASVGARFNASEVLTVTAGLRAVDAYSQFDPVDFATTGLPSDGDLATDSANVYVRAGVALDTHGGKARHSLDFNYFDSQHKNLVQGIEDSTASSDRLTLRFQSDITLGSNGLSVAFERQDLSYRYRGQTAFGDPNQDQQRDTTSFIAEYQGLSNERFTWLLSGRYDKNSDFKDALNGRLSLSWLVNNTSTLRASVGSGRKDPSFTELFGFFPGQFVGNPDLKPESSVSYDLGIDKSFADSTVLLQVSLFHQDLEDEINGFVFDPVSFVQTAENVDGSSRRSGLELAARWNINAAFSTRLSYTYTDASEENGVGEDIRELRRPRHAGSASLEYRSPEEGFQTMLVANYGGSRSDRYFPPFPASPEIVTLGDHLLIDITAQYRLTPSLTIFARGANLLDEDYEEVFGYSTLGRTGYLGARLTFGD